MITVSLAGGTSALGATARVDGLGPGMLLSAGGGDLLGDARASADVELGHAILETLQAQGVRTQGRATALLLDGAEGPAWTFVFDGGEGLFDADSLRAALSSAPEGVSFAADDGAGLAMASLPAGALEGDFRWTFSAMGEANGGALPEMIDVASTGFSRDPSMLRSTGLFQFLSWDAGEGRWLVAGTQSISSQNATLAYRVVAVPTPVSAGMGLIGLGGLATIRRRRR